jgi:guanylate kinase
VNDKGLFDYLILNDELETCYQELLRVAKRAAQGLGPEPGMMPDQVLLEDGVSWLAPCLGNAPVCEW